MRQAEIATQALFDQMAAAGHDMRHLHHLALPARRDAWFGYAAVYQTLGAIYNRRPLPALATAILSHRQHPRRELVEELKTTDLKQSRRDEIIDIILANIG